MAAGDHFYEVGQGHGLPHDPLLAIIAPRPIAWISSVSATGQANLAPYSYFNVVSNRPPIISFSSVGWKDSIANISETGEFVINMVSRDLLPTMNRTSATFASGIDEAAVAGVEMEASNLVAPRRVAGTPAALECRLLTMVPVCDLRNEPAGCHVVLGQVVGVHIARSCLREGRYDPVAARIVARCGYRGDYVQVQELFELVRPAAP
jgi:flavin reductase (DIM6/NTAB) family NADH-FMN oxidoreductase RutF